MYNFIAKLLNFIESSTDHTKIDVIIAEYILRHVEQIPDMSIYDLAKACHTSPATITRFCRKFENITFKELKEYARHYIEFNYSEVNLEKINTNANRQNLDLYFKELQDSLEETKKLLQSQDIFEVVQNIHQAHKVAFFGVTFSHLLARNAQFKFMRLGKYSSAYSNHENQLNEAQSLTEKDLAVIFSFSGQTRFITRLVKLLSQRGIPIIAITGNNESFLASRAKKVILVSERRLISHKSPILEEISLLSVLNSIYLIYSTYLNSIE